MKSLNAERKQAFLFLKQIIKKYENQKVFMNIKREIFLPVIQKNLQEEGVLYLQKEKFHLKMKGRPGYFMIFDGKHLWYQPDTGEKIVFKFEDHPQRQIFSGLFNSQLFFQFFSVLRFVKKNKRYVFHLSFRENPGDLDIFVTLGKFIEEIKLVGKNSDSVQRYKILKPWFKKQLSKSLFLFPRQNFKIILGKNL